VPSPVPLILLAFFWFGYRLFFQASAQMPTRGIYSDVTLPYLTLTVQRGAATALDSVQVPHCDYADDIALTSNTAECLQFQLNKFHNYTRFKGLKLNTDKTKIMVFFSKDTSAIPTFTYDGTPLELVNHFKYLGFTLTRDGSMHTAAEKMADNLRLAIARVYKTGSSKGITHRKHAMLWLFQVFALTAGLYGCQVWPLFH